MLYKFALISISICLLVTGLFGQAVAYDDITGDKAPIIKPLEPDDPKALTLKREAERSLIRARNAIKNSGFFCANIELNIWKNLSSRAGAFDEKLYEELKSELYTSSMQHQDKWFTYYLKKGYYNDAQKCLQTWRLHALAIDRFDEGLYAQKAADLEAIKE